MMNVNMTDKQVESMSAFRSFVGSDTFTRQDYENFKSKAKDSGIILPRFLIRNNFSEKVGRGEWKFPEVNGTSSVSTVVEDATVSLATHATAARVESAEMVTNVIEFPKNASESYVPSKVDGYVKFGHYNDVKTIKKSGNFYPIFITGLSGNGKTMMIEQIHAELKKEFC